MLLEAPRHLREAPPPPRLCKSMQPESRVRAVAVILGICSLLTGCHRTPPAVPLNQLNAQQQRGHGVFIARCALCHADRDDKAMKGPALLGLYKKPYLPSGAPANDERVTAVVLHGRNMMPAQPYLGPAYSPGDLDDLIAYLHTL